MATTGRVRIDPDNNSIDRALYEARKRKEEEEQQKAAEDRKRAVSLQKDSELLIKIIDERTAELKTLRERLMTKFLPGSAQGLPMGDDTEEAIHIIQSVKHLDAVLAMTAIRRKNVHEEAQKRYEEGKGGWLTSLGKLFDSTPKDDNPASK